VLAPSAPLCDVAFVADNKRINAHSVIVSAYVCPHQLFHKLGLFSRSPHLASMIAMHRRFSPTKEDIATIRIPKARFVVFQGLLRYLYTDHLKVPLYFIPEVAALARRFRLDRLVTLCTRLLGSSRRPVNNSSTESTITADLQAMVDADRFSDITFLAQPDGQKHGEAAAEGEIAAHKAVLIARCPYFRALWDTTRGFSDINRRTVSVPFSAPVIDVILRYIYGGNETKVPLVDGQNALEVLSAADYFLLDDLKQICEDVLERELSNDDELLHDRDLVSGICDSAQRHSARRLEAFCSLQLELSQ